MLRWLAPVWGPVAGVFMAEKKGPSKGLEVRAEQARLAFDALPFSQVTVLMAATLAAVVLWPVIGSGTVLPWVAAVYLISLARLLLALGYWRVQPVPARIRPWTLGLRAGALLGALAWGGAGYLLFAVDSIPHQGLLAFVLAGVTAGGVVSLATQRDLVIAFPVIVTMPLLYRFAETSHPLAHVMPVLVLLFMVFMVALGLRIHRHLTDMVIERQERRSVESRERRRNLMLEMLAKGAGLGRILEALVLGIEEEHPEMRGSILLLDKTGKHLHTAAAPSLPKSYTQAIDGLRIGPGVGSCGACAHTQERVVVENIATHPFWVPFRDAAARAGLGAAWSEPVFSSSGRLLGTFAIYHRDAFSPSAEDLAMLEQAAHLAGIAIERSEAEEALRLAALVYQHSSEAMMITDERNRVVAINPAFTEMSGYSEDDIVGKGPNVLRSRRHDDAFYQKMWEELERTGSWQGEIWNRGKDGEDYVTWLTIETIQDAEKKTHRRMALFSDVTEKKQTDARIWVQANYDALTNLPNRRLFLDRLEHGIRVALRSRGRLALLYIDLDRFKEVNDTFGHLMGDEVLMEAARRIKACVRDADTVARLGGDEFTVILNEIEEAGAVGRVAEKIISALDQPYSLGNEQAFISGSVGIAMYPDDATDAVELLNNADQAMFAAKQKGRNRYSYFTEELLEAAQQRMRLVGDLQRASREGEFVVLYQPIIELATGRVAGAEALVRWNRPGHGQVAPADFIPVAEETGAIRGIGNQVFREATRKALHWREAYDSEFHISVNRSQTQFLAEGPDADEWVDFLEELGLPGRALVIEIKEDLLLRASRDIGDKLLRLRDAGIRIAIDDFGTGYSSLAYLKRYQIDYLKIDRTFVANLEGDEINRALSEAMVVMAHKLGFRVIAEGVETRGQHEILVAMGCDFAQGHLFSKPIPADDFDALLQIGRDEGAAAQA
jgi:diguanylate cyclase (GGDEF)-like protein/PAS domain S-box-containing protein